MDPRQQRGLEIAARCKLTRKGDAWMVPSPTNGEVYTVRPDPQTPHCSCPDHETRGVVCKHLFAVRYVMEREENADGTTTVTQSVTITETVRKTYPQNWKAYNKAQTNEKHRFQVLLHDLCRLVPDQQRSMRGGRRRLRLADAIFSATFKVFSTVSGRRFMCDLNDAHAKGFISKVPHFNSIFNYLENPALKPILKALIVRASLPLKSLETNFAVDSTGFSTCRFDRRTAIKYGGGETYGESERKQRRSWVKAHIMTGVKSNVVTSVEIEGMHTGDCPMFRPLVETTAQNFAIEDVSADKAYLSKENADLVDLYGGEPFIAFKSNSVGEGGGVWSRMFHFYQFHRDAFLARYHQRSNVESTVHMIKAKFRDSVRSKTETAQVNEVLCKILAHNIVCVIQSMYEVGIEPTGICADLAAAQEPLPLA